MRNTDGTFLKGFSGNKSGRPAVVTELQKLARAQTPAALGTLVEVMTDAASPPNARVAAAVALLDRGYGRPSNAVVIENAQEMTSEEREALLKSLTDAMDEHAARLGATEKRAVEAERRVAELESVGGGRPAIASAPPIGGSWTSSRN